MKTTITPLIFVVDDDIIYQELLKNELEQNNFNSIEMFDNGSDCLKNLNKKPNIVILDYRLNEKMNGVQVLKKIKSIDENIQVIMLSSQEKLEVVINSIKYGAYDYIIKNDIAIRKLSQLITRICKWNELVFENVKFEKRRNLFLSGLAAFIVIVMVFRFIFPRYFF